MSNKHIMSALGYGLLGLILGIYMASSKNHSQLVTHAHTMLLGFVVSFIYGVLIKVWSIEHKLVFIQFLCHQVGTVVLLISLFCMYGGLVEKSTLGPFLGISSIIVFVGMVLMKIMFIQQSKSNN